MTFHILGMSSSQLTKSYFSEGLKPPTRNSWGYHGDMMGIYLLDNLTNNWGKLCCDLTVLYTWTKMGIVRGIIPEALIHVSELL